MNIFNPIIRMFLQEKGHGFKAGREKVDEKHHYLYGDEQLDAIFGAAQVIKSDGQWDQDLPRSEIQKFPWGDTMHCTVYGTENCIQTLGHAKYGMTDEYTERYLGVLAGISKSGGSPHTVIEQWRKEGNLYYEELPFENVNSWEEFNSPNPMTEELKAKGREWLSKYAVGHEWISPGFVGSMEGAIKTALQSSPVGVGVYAWNFDNAKGVYTKPSWASDNHWVMCYGYVDGKYWKIYDHYDNIKKKVDWNYPWAFAKKYTLEKKNQTEIDAGHDIFDRIKGKHAIVMPVGAVYYVDSMEVVHEPWWTNSEWMQSVLDRGLREEEKKGNFIGISETDFNNLKKYINLAGIPLKEDPKVLSAINKLNK